MSLRALEQQPQNVRFESQEPKEKLYFLLRKHPITNLWWIGLTLTLLLLPIIGFPYIAVKIPEILAFFPAQYKFSLLIVWYMVTLFLAFESFVLWYFNVYIITDKRVIDVDFPGLWKKRVSEAPLRNVEDASYSTHKFWQVIFDYGDIIMQTAAEITEFEFHDVPKPSVVHDTLTDLVEQAKGRE